MAKQTPQSAKPGQIVANLAEPTAEDVIIQGILDPTSDPTPDKISDVVPLKVEDVGGEVKDVHGDKQLTPKDQAVVTYVPNKGFISSNWSNFEVDPKAENVTSDSKGVFIKHLAKTLLSTPDDSGKPAASVEIKSISYCSPTLAGNAWTNTLFFNPTQPN